MSSRTVMPHASDVETATAYGPAATSRASGGHLYTPQRDGHSRTTAPGAADDADPRSVRCLIERGMSDDRLIDARLVERTRSGDSEALGELYDRHAGAALAVALRVTGDRQEAEDVVHDAFVVVWRKIARFDPERGSLRAWLMTIVRNRAIDRIRTRRPAIDLDDADERSLLRTGPNPTWEQALRRTSAAEVHAAMATLPAEQRRAVELAYFEGYTYREVAQVMDVAPGTASGRMRLALAKLREALADTPAAPLWPDRLAEVPDR